MKQVSFDMLYAVADFLYANSTEGERTTILRETKRGRREDKGLCDNNRISYFDKKTNKRIFKKILKTFKQGAVKSAPGRVRILFTIKFAKNY